MRRKSINTAAKNREVSVIRFFASLNLKGRCLVTMWCDIVQLEEVIDGIWPLFGRKAGTGEHSTDGIGIGFMGTFDWAILVSAFQLHIPLITRIPAITGY
jgi:hypothetical protein